MFTGDDFNYAELIAGDEQGYSRRAARHLRRHRAGGLRRARSRFAHGDVALFHDILGADRAAVAPHLQGADAVLQDRRGVHGLSERPCRTTSPWSAARRARARPCISPSCSGLADAAGPACSMPSLRAAPRCAPPWRCAELIA